MPANNTIVLDVLDPSSATIEGLVATLVLTSPNDPKLSISVEATSGARDGGLSFDLSETRLVLKYEYSATVTVSRQFIDPTTYLDASIRKTIRLTDAGDGVNWTTVDLESWSVPAREATVSIATKKVEVQNAYDAYITAKTTYEATLASAETIELEQLEPYEPTSPTYVVTRLLEFRAGTLEAAIRYATDAQLGTQLDYLNRINKFVNLYVGLYPTVTIEDGEGIPYQPK
jgi:hypothetical protein